MSKPIKPSALKSNIKFAPTDAGITSFANELREIFGEYFSAEIVPATIDALAFFASTRLEINLRPRAVADQLKKILGRMDRMIDGRSRTPQQIRRLERTLCADLANLRDVLPWSLLLGGKLDAFREQLKWDVNSWPRMTEAGDEATGVLDSLFELSGRAERLQLEPRTIPPPPRPPTADILNAWRPLIAAAANVASNSPRRNDRRLPLVMTVWHLWRCFRRFGQNIPVNDQRDAWSKYAHKSLLFGDQFGYLSGAQRATCRKQNNTHQQARFPDPKERPGNWRRLISVTQAP